MLQNIIFHTEVPNENRLEQSTHVMRWSERGSTSSTFVGLYGSLGSRKQRIGCESARRGIDLEAVRKVGR